MADAPRTKATLNAADITASAAGEVRDGKLVFTSVDAAVADLSLSASPVGTITTVGRYARADLRANRGVLYVFGDNEARQGRGGQAAAARGEPNAAGVRTKRAPSNAPSAFWTDDDFERNAAMIDEDLAPVRKHLASGGAVVWPADGIGSGRAQLAQRAPRTARYLADAAAALLAEYGARP